MTEIDVPNFENPAEVAAPFAQSIGLNPQFRFEIDEERLLPHLDSIADETDMFGMYFVTTNSAFSVPVSWEKGEPVNTITFNKLDFEGPFVSYALIRMGKIGNYTVRALCLSFSEAKLLPHLEDIPENHLLYVPVLAVDNIIRTDKA